MAGLGTRTAGVATAGDEFAAKRASTDRRLLVHWGIVDGTDAAQTLAINALTILPALTASRNITLPVIVTKGDRCSVCWPTGHATNDAILLTGAGNTCLLKGISISAASEITRLFIPGEYISFLAISTTQWIIDPNGGDGRIRMQGLLRLSTSTNATESAATWVYPTDRSGVWTADYDTGNVTATATGRITVRRATSVFFSGAGCTLTNIADQTQFSVSVELNASNVNTVFAQVSASAVTAVGATPSRSLAPVPLAVGDYARLRYQSSAGSIGLLGAAPPLSIISMTENL